MKGMVASAALVSTLLFAVMQYGCSTDSDAHSRGEGKSQKTGGADTTKTAAKDSAGTNDEEAIPVEVATVKSGAISSYLLLSSNLETEEMADVYSRVQGLVQKIEVEEGDWVEKGQLLMTLEADEYTLAAEKARVNFEKQHQAFERAEAMFKKQLLSREEFEQAKFTAQAAEIEWKQAKLNLDYTRITAPIAGVVGERLRRPGDRIQPSDKLFTVINSEEMIAVVHIPEKELGHVSKGQQAYLTSDNLLGQQFAGWIKRVSPVVDPQSGTFKVTIGVRNAHSALRPGMFVNAHIITATHDKAVLVPKTAIVYENEYLYTFVVKDGIAQKTRIVPGFQDFANIEATEAITPGDQIIVVGYAGLKDQAKVKIVASR